MVVSPYTIQPINLSSLTFNLWPLSYNPTTQFYVYDIVQYAGSPSTRPSRVCVRGTGSKILPLNFSTSFQFVFHKGIIDVTDIVLNDLSDALDSLSGHWVEMSVTVSGGEG